MLPQQLCNFFDAVFSTFNQPACFLYQNSTWHDMLWIPVLAFNGLLRHPDPNKVILGMEYVLKYSCVKSISVVNKIRKVANKNYAGSVDELFFVHRVDTMVPKVGI